MIAGHIEEIEEATGESMEYATGTIKSQYVPYTTLLAILQDHEEIFHNPYEEEGKQWSRFLKMSEEDLKALSDAEIFEEFDYYEFNDDFTLLMDTDKDGVRHYVVYDWRE
jgi:hypothetical protein